MRLRITVRRHCLPDTPIIWNVDLGSSTISELLTKVNEIIPIESGEWGLEDYAVDLKGSNSVNYECLHFQEVGKVMKEDDEVIIRPLLTQDLKIRRVSGRTQITSDAKHLVDGVPFGRPLLRRPAADRPVVKIPSRKRARITYNESEGLDEDVEGGSRGGGIEDDEVILALTGKVQTEAGGSGNENNNREMVLHADFEDDDSEDDEDFLPGEDEEDEDGDELDTDEDEMEEQEEPEKSGINSEAENEEAPDESDLNDVPDQETRTKIRKLHSAFPTSPLAVCKYILNGSGGDIGEAYGTMLLGFQPVKSASAITETSKASSLVPTTRSRKRKATDEAEASDSMEIEAANTEDSLLLEHYDQNGLPPGSISSGKALSIMAEAVQSSPGQRPNSRGSNSGSSSKNVRFLLGSGLMKGFTSTPAIDRESLADDTENESDGSSSDVTSSSGTSSSEEDSSSGDEKPDDVAESSDTSSSASDSDSDSDSSSDEDGRGETSSKPNSSNPAKRADQESDDTSSSDSDSDSDGDASSDDDVPEETSSKPTNNKIADPVTTLTVPTPQKPTASASVQPRTGTKTTHSRNIRRKNANALSRFKMKGILPAGTTLSEFIQLPKVTDNTSPEDALAALEALRADTTFSPMNEHVNRSLANSTEFEARRKALLASLANGGIEVAQESVKLPSRKASTASSFQVQNTVAHTKSTPPIDSNEHLKDTSDALATPPEMHQSLSRDATSQTQLDATLKVAAPVVSAEVGFDLAIPRSATESKPSTPSSEMNPSNSTLSRRAKLDLGAGRRMLFGALGIKAPKTKKDEENIRSDLMKDVRPTLTPKTTEKLPEEDEEDAEDQDSEAWRDKITLRAVECCYDGIKLSEPPFPFVQRWDPQQQGGWPQKNKNGKRKKHLRDQAQFYEEDAHQSKKQKQRKREHSYAEHQEYLNASYEPSYQEDSMMEGEELTQQSRLPSNDIEFEVNQQLMNDLAEKTSAQVSQGPEDLAPLPADPQTLADLQAGQAKPGMTIAFKELTMSEETKWQPEISPYRTAVINAILDGELQLTLALRDRITLEKAYDVETGDRLYGKFDMPDQDEDEEAEEDDGIRGISFSQLVEPKIVQEAPEGLDSRDHQTNDAALPKRSSSDSQTLSQEHEDEAADAQFSHVTETPLNSDAPDSSLQESTEEPIPQLLDAGMTQEEGLDHGASPRSAHHVISEVDTPSQTAAGLLVAPEDQEPSPIIDKGKGKVPAKENTVEETEIAVQESSPVDDPDTSIEQVSTDARLKISQMIKDAGFRSSVLSSVTKDIRPTAMESPGDSNVLEQLWNDMTDTASNPPYSPKFHGLDASSPIKILRTVSKDKLPSSSPARVPQSSWQTYDTDAVSSPAMQDEDESSWQTIDLDEPSSPPVKMPLKRVAESEAAPARKLKFPKMGRAQEMWEALQPTDGKTSVQNVTSNVSPGPSGGLDGSNEKESSTFIQYPKLSVTSSFTSQVSDHGRQPDVTFDDSIITNIDIPKVPAFENDSFMNQGDEPMTDSEEPELPLHSSSSSKQKQREDAMDWDGEPELPPKLTINDFAKSRSITPDVLRGSPSSDDMFPSLEEVLSQRDTTKEETTPVKTKASKSIKAEKGRKKAQSVDLDLSDNEDVTPRASQKHFRPSKGQSSPAASQTRKSPRHSKIRAFQTQPPQSRQTQSQPQHASTQQSVVVDLTLSSSEVEAEPEENFVVSDVEEQQKKFKTYTLSEDGDDEDAGWVPKKSTSQKPVGTRRQSSGAGLKSASQSSFNTTKKRTTARF
ncbi:hypothetical protein D0Z07_0132 [Hyphodiscus hymeniophilus]|uniref:Clumping factor B n=1 Tax=Hyphodiscus hymeniophilus TaxID=353542 RepID=A0A9P6VRN2_9HELO|nr:hypothetical protein D0Z07_0132 [Hyphodiscus hymeniophilus]